MSSYSILFICCICIEIWHIIFYAYLYDKRFRYVEQVIKWAESYGKFYKYFIEFTKYYTENLDLTYALGLESNHVFLDLLHQFQKIGGEQTGRSNILKLTRIRYLCWFLLFQAIEFVYWVLLLLILIFTPNGFGILVFILTFVLSKLQIHLNPHKHKSLLIVDSVFCILLFAVMAIKFYAI